MFYFLSFFLPLFLFTKKSSGDDDLSSIASVPRDSTLEVGSTSDAAAHGFSIPTLTPAAAAAAGGGAGEDIATPGPSIVSGVVQVSPLLPPPVEVAGAARNSAAETGEEGPVHNPPSVGTVSAMALDRSFQSSPASAMGSVSSTASRDRAWSVSRHPSMMGKMDEESKEHLGNIKKEM